MAQIGIISAHHDEDWHAQQIARAAARHGRVVVLEPRDFAAEVGPSGPRVTVRGADADDYSLFFTPRALGDEGDADLQLEIYRLLASSGARLVNDVAPLLLAIDKLRTSWELARAGVPTPPAAVAQTRPQLDAALASLGEVVVKPLYGSLGLGVERLTAGDGERARRLLEERGAVYLQRYVRGRELRAFVVGDTVAAAMLRRPRKGALHGNLARGATAKAAPIEREWAELAVRATRVVGLDYAGIDLIVSDDDGPLVLEVNGTPSFRGIHDVCGRDMAPAIVDHALGSDRARQPTQARRHDGANEWPRVP